MLILFGALGGGTGLWFKLKMTLRLLVQILHWKLIFQCLRYTKMCSKEASETWLFLKNEVDQCRILLCPKTNDNVTVEKHLYYFIKHVFLCLHWSLFFFFKSQCIEKKKKHDAFPDLWTEFSRSRISVFWKKHIITLFIVFEICIF